MAISSGTTKKTVRRWQERFAEEGIAGLQRDKTRPPGTSPLADEIKAKVLAKTATETPPNATCISCSTTTPPITQVKA